MLEGQSAASTILHCLRWRADLKVSIAESGGMPILCLLIDLFCVSGISMTDGSEEFKAVVITWGRVLTAYLEGTAEKRGKGRPAEQVRQWQRQLRDS